MKKILLIIALFPLLASGQNSIVSTPNTTFLYKGLNNPVQCAVEGYSCNDIVLICHTQNVIFSGNGCNYFAQTWSSQPVKFSILSKKDSTVLDTFSLAVADVPDPEARFHRNQIHSVKLDFIIVTNPVWEKFNVPFKIIEFELYCYHEKKELFNVTNTGAVFNDETLKKIGQTRREDEIILRRIVLDVDGQTLSYIVYDRYIIQ